MPSLPVDGATGWGDTLNAYLTALSTEAGNTQTSLASHTSNSPADPHGDRAYAAGLVSPITSGVNVANGYVKLDSSGRLPLASIYATTTGLFTNVYDAVANYGAVANTGADQTTAIQAALTACGSAGGGIVFLGAGTFSIKSTLHVSSNTWLMMTPGTIIQRIAGTTNAKVLIDNFVGGAAQKNITISGGLVDAYGSTSVTSACIPIIMINGSYITIRGVRIGNWNGAGPAIEINSCSHVWIQNCILDGYGNGSTSLNGYPAIRMNNSYTSTSLSNYSAITVSSSPPNLFDLHIEDCVETSELSNSLNNIVYATILDSDLAGSSTQINVFNAFILNNIAEFTCTNSNLWGGINTPSHAIWSSFLFTNNNLSTANLFNTWVAAGLPGGGWTGTLRYRATPSADVEVDCLITNVTPSSGSLTLFTLPSALPMSTGLYWPLVLTVSGVTQTGFGQMSGQSVTANLPSGTTRVSFNQHLPLN